MTPFLTRIEINPRRRASQRVLASPHRMHGAVNLCFPPSTVAGRTLWRIDRTTTATYLYLVSDVAPDATGFVEEHGWPAAGGWITRDYGSVLDKVRDGASFSFRLAANPVRHRRPASEADVAGVSERTRGKRVAHVTAAHQMAWLIGRATDWGFEVGTVEEPTARIVERRVLVFPRAGQDVTVGLAVFEGLLKVIDAAELRRRLVQGIGPAKAYGCGLLTLAPPTS